MNIDLAILELQKIILNDFNQYAPTFKKYERLLHKEIKENPNNIRAVSLLSIIKCELRKSIDLSLKYLKRAYDDNKDTMNDSEYSLIATNIAYFYIEECTKKDQIAKELLELAVKHNSLFSQTYYALALLYYKLGEYENALPLFKKAADISSLYRYIYNYSICLYKCGNVLESIELLKTHSIGWENNEYKTRAYFSLGVIYSYIGQIDHAKQIALNLLEIDYETFDIEHNMLADLMFSVCEFEQCINLYDKEKLWESSDWLILYFYRLKSLNHNSDAIKKLYEITKNINHEIHNCTLEDFDGNEKKQTEYIYSEKERLNSITTAYNSVFFDNTMPISSYETHLIYGCYYIDCPRHSLDDIQNTSCI